jgi:FkbM family methyltransferase
VGAYKGDFTANVLDALPKLGSLNLDLIKVDAQGNAFKVLQGAARTIQKHHPLMMVECIFVPVCKEQDSL